MFEIGKGYSLALYLISLRTGSKVIEQHLPGGTMSVLLLYHSIEIHT